MTPQLDGLRIHSSQGTRPNVGQFSQNRRPTLPGEISYESTNNRASLSRYGNPSYYFTGSNAPQTMPEASAYNQPIHQTPAYTGVTDVGGSAHMSAGYQQSSYSAPFADTQTTYPQNTSSTEGYLGAFYDPDTGATAYGAPTVNDPYWAESPYYQTARPEQSLPCPPYVDRRNASASTYGQPVYHTSTYPNTLAPSEPHAPTPSGSTARADPYDMTEYTRAVSPTKRPEKRRGVETRQRLPRLDSKIDDSESGEVGGQAQGPSVRKKQTVLVSPRVRRGPTEDEDEDEDASPARKGRKK
ncbi:hypothetical protein F5B19DRAFT_488734 [Rostrohypoxylon terebratum]|nr:hypothetical protein F5B19DRAFT_488734 [Rostrohypoxylon terebratum]